MNICLTKTDMTVFWLVYAQTVGTEQNIQYTLFFISMLIIYSKEKIRLVICSADLYAVAINK